MASLLIDASVGHHSRDTLALVVVDVAADVGGAREVFSTEGGQSLEGMASEGLAPGSPGDRNQQLLKALANISKDINQGRGPGGEKGRPWGPGPGPGPDPYPEAELERAGKGKFPLGPVG